MPELNLTGWGQAFDLLASQVSEKPTLILLDEISWMGRYDPDFCGKLKVAWDTKFSHNNKLIIAVCGSVSSWIQENILNDTNFVGRLSSSITLQELPLADCSQFWGRDRNISAFEKLKFLSVSGGVPRYLEEINPGISAEENITHLALNPSGFLFDELERIFDDSFDSSKTVYRNIIQHLQSRHLSYSEIAKKLKMSKGGTLTGILENLELSGFITQDPIWNFDGKESKVSRYRLSDNYIRFYLRCVKPKKKMLRQNISDNYTLSDIPNWRSILGLQFENLVYSNLSFIVTQLGIRSNQIKSIGPYFQRKTTKNKGACQIDLMIHSEFDTLYLCELKFKQKIEKDILNFMKRKISVLKRPKYFSVRPVLICAGELSEDVEPYFYRCVDLGEALCNEKN